MVTSLTGEDSTLSRRRRTRRIQPAKGWLRVDFHELWRFRELLFFLVWRDMKVRYKQTVLGASWALFRPVISMVVFSVIFGHLAGIRPGTDVPYALFVFAGLAPVYYFTSALSGGSSSIIGNSSLVTKTYFPRILLPLSAVAAPVVDFALSFLVLFGIFAWYDRAPDPRAPAVVGFLGLALFFSFGLALAFSAVTVRYRDATFAIPFLTQLWMYVTPVIYPVTLIPPRWHWLIALNPMTGVVAGFRWALFGMGAFPTLEVLVSLGVSAVVVAVGLLYFGRVERRFADVI